MEKITIIGAGIAGLTTAIALRKNGFEVEVFETAPEFSNAGSGINLALNAMQVFKRLGLYEDIKMICNDVHKMNSLKMDLNVITSSDLKSFEKNYGVSNVAIHRAALHKVLLKHLDDTPVYSGKKLRSLEQEDNKVLLQFEDDSTHTSKIVIGADGIRSVVRQSIFEDTRLRDAGQVCWRGISPVQLSEKYKTELNEAWGVGRRFGFVQISEDSVYWYALINKNKWREGLQLDELFSEFHPIILQIIQETPENNILFNEIWDLEPIEKWYKGNVCLIGDAAHATTPNMGQGACQAIESALALSIQMKEESVMQKAFENYQKIRYAKANYIIETSWKLGKLAQTDSVFVALLRDMLLPLVPGFITRKLNKRVFGLNF